MANPTDTATTTSPPPPPPPEITILLLGSPGIGKSTFISRIPETTRSGPQRRSRPPASQSQLQSESQSQPQSQIRPSSLNGHGTYGADTKGVPSSAPESASRSRFTPNPSSFQVTLFARPYTIVIHRSESPIFIDPFPSRRPDFVILAFAVDDRVSLHNAQFYWRRQFEQHYSDINLYSTQDGIATSGTGAGNIAYNYGPRSRMDNTGEDKDGEKEMDQIPVMLLGLKRDLRTDEVEYAYTDPPPSSSSGGGSGENSRSLGFGVDDDTRSGSVNKNGNESRYVKHGLGYVKEDGSSLFDDDNDDDDVPLLNGGSSVAGKNGKRKKRYKHIMPQEALRAAQEMRCDRYAECSALTGELMFEAVEDITRTAAKTTTENGGLSEGSSCVVM